jgi:nucleotide-binding universal stress UspA family protein
MTVIRTILCPTDFSRYSGYAFELACTLAREYGAQLHVLHVAAPPDVSFPGGPPPEHYHPERAAALHRLLPADPQVRVRHRLVEGDVGQEIVRMAHEIASDLIIMGTHGRTGLRRLLMGSVAEQVLRRAPCPVLTVRLPPSVSTRPADEGAELARAFHE